MASIGDVDRNVTITFIGRDRASSAMRSIGGSATRTTGTVGRLTAMLKKMALAAGVALAAAVAAASVAIYKFGKYSVEAASDLNESINAVNVTFGKAAKGIHALGKTAASSLGLARSEFNQFAVQFSGTVKQIADSPKDIVPTMDELTTRIADFASVMNISVPEAAEKFQSALAGESEPMKRFGIAITDATINQYALRTGMIESSGTMTEQQKVLARYGLLLQKTNNFAGDFKNTQWSWANVQKRIGAEIEDVAAKVGKALIPTLEMLGKWIMKEGVPWLKHKLVPAVKDLSKWIQDNGDTVRSWGEILKGTWTVVVAITAAVMGFFRAVGKVNKALQTLFGFDVSFLIQMKVAVLTLQHPLTALSIVFSGVVNWLSRMVYWADRFISRIASIAAAVAKIPSFDLPGVPGLAAGGYVDRRAFGGWTMVGEHGPELISNRGFVKPHSASMGGAGGGGVTVVINGPIDAVSTGREVRKALLSVKRAEGGRALGLA